MKSSDLQSGGLTIFFSFQNHAQKKSPSSAKSTLYVSSVNGVEAVSQLCRIMTRGVLCKEWMWLRHLMLTEYPCLPSHFPAPFQVGRVMWLELTTEPGGSKMSLPGQVSKQPVGLCLQSLIPSGGDLDTAGKMLSHRMEADEIPEDQREEANIFLQPVGPFSADFRYLVIWGMAEGPISPNTLTPQTTDH